MARIGRPDTLWSVNKLARAVTKWTQACDRRLAILISYTPHTNEFRQYCHVGNTAQHCRLGLFQDSDFAGDLEDSKSESEIISLDAGLRMDGLLALEFWDMVIEVLRSTNSTARHCKLAQGDLCGTGDHSINRNKTTTSTETRERVRLSNCQMWITYPTNTHSSQGKSQLYIFEDNEPVIKMIIKG